MKWKINAPDVWIKHSIKKFRSILFPEILTICKFVASQMKGNAESIITSEPIQWTLKLKSHRYQKDRIKGLILRRFNAFCGAAAIHAGSARGLRLVHCGRKFFFLFFSLSLSLQIFSCLLLDIYLKKGKKGNQCTRNVPSRALRLVHCGSYLQICSCCNAQSAAAAACRVGRI